MAITIVRLGTPKAPGEGSRLGTVRRPPRGVRKADIARLQYYDVWLPELSPSAALVSSAMASDWTPASWQWFTRRYLREMRTPQVQHLLATLAALSHQTNFSVGCYCEHEERCHRSVLRRLLTEAGAVIDR